ncbi:glycosyltransferase family protein, partial [Psychrobacter sp. 1Y4]
MKFSLLMSVYPKDNSELFRQALQSILVNSLQPAEVVLVCDGPLTIELEKVIDYYDNKFSMILLKLNENVGLGRAL